MRVSREMGFLSEDFSLLLAAVAIFSGNCELSSNFISLPSALLLMEPAGDEGVDDDELLEWILS